MMRSGQKIRFSPNCPHTCFYLQLTKYRQSALKPHQDSCTTTARRLGAAKGLKKVTAGNRDPKIKQRALENKCSTQQLQISSLLSASFVLCFQTIKYMYTAIEHFSFLFVIHALSKFVCFLVSFPNG